MRAAVRSAIASVAVGMALNTVCWWVNGGMPVQGWAQQSNWAHHLATDLDKLPWLWDRFAMFGLIFSVGDLFLVAGFLLFAVALPGSWERLFPHVTGPGLSVRFLAAGITPWPHPRSGET